MKIRVYKLDIMYYLVLVVVVLNIGLLRILDGEIFSSNYPFRYLTCALIFWMLILKQTKIGMYWKSGLIVILCIMASELIISKINYNESIVNIFKQNIHIWYYLILIPLLCIEEQKKRINIFRFITVMTIVTLLLKSISWYMINFHGVVIFENFLTEFGTMWIRNGFYRYNSTPFGSLTFLLVSYELITKKKKSVLKLVILIFIIWYDVTIYQSRAELVICILSFCSIFLLWRRKDAARFIMKYTSVFICIAGVLMSGVLSEFLESFNVATSSGGTTRLRIEAAVYYLPYFRSNVVIGIGFLDNSNNSTLMILRGASGNRYLDDLGILGFIFQFGICGVIIILIIMWRMVRIFLRMQDDKCLLGGLLTLFVLMSVISSSPFDSQRIIVVPFFLAIFEWVYKGNVKFLVQEVK